MAYDAQGNWKMEDDSVSKQLSGIINSNSPLMQQAATAGKQYANKRGLLNSTMGAQATQAALYQQAVPMASQQAQQISTKNATAMQLGSQEKIAAANISANDREKAMSAAVAYENSFAEAWRTVAQAHDLPAAVREKYLESITVRHRANLNVLEQMYGIKLEWASPSTSVTPPSTGSGGGGTTGGTTAPGGTGAPLPTSTGTAWNNQGE